MGHHIQLLHKPSCPNDILGKMTMISPSVSTNDATLALSQKIEHLRHALRPGQREMANWQGGALAVSAVPGAGKSHGMAAAAAIAIARHHLDASRQLVLVTFTRSAATHLKQKVRQFLRDLDQPQSGFVVQTLHSLALNIASRHPQQSGLDLTRTTLISTYQGHRLMRQCVDQWIQTHPQFYRLLLEAGSFSGEDGERLRRQSALRSDILPALAQTTIREAKSSGLLPENLYDLANTLGDELPILAIAAGLYEQYNSLLRKSGWIDYDDMILSALRVLADPLILKTWQQQVFAVFEDEAQDSTPLQFQLLDRLAACPDHPGTSNLIRVGDPNQAINASFTPADPIYFRRFCQNRSRENRLAEMIQSARSCQPIIDAANFILDWANCTYAANTERPFNPQVIQPVSPTDRIYNPDPIGRGVELYFPPDIFQSVEWIGQRTIALLAANPDLRVAVLVRENKQARFICDVLSDPKRYGLSVQLADHNIPIYDVGERDRRSGIPAQILALLQFVARPHSSEYFKTALTHLAQRQIIPTYDFNQITSEPEQFLYPSPLAPDQSQEDQSKPTSTEIFQAIRATCCQILDARRALPLYQLISFLALELNYDVAELATADKLASRLHQQLSNRSTLAALIEALQDIVSSERFDPVDLETDESQYTRPHQLTLMTMHKAKGLDWDVVFLPFLHEKVIPGSLWTPNPAKFLGDYTLADVARAQIRAHLHQQNPLPSSDAAWQQAKDLKVAEEFRLLYVAMTRAKQLLWLSAAQNAPYSWGTFNWERQSPLDPQKPCPVLPALKQRFPRSFVSIKSNI